MPPLTNFEIDLLAALRRIVELMDRHELFGVPPSLRTEIGNLLARAEGRS
jgi:hypothetical protein